MKNIFLILLLFLFVQIISAQTLSNIIEKDVLIKTDTIIIDTLSIVPGSLEIYVDNNLLSPDMYVVNYEESMVVFCNVALFPKENSYKIKYRVFPINFYDSYFHKDIILLKDSLNKGNKKRYIPNDDEETFFSDSKLTKSGSISRGINFGNNQDVSVNSDFNCSSRRNITTIA